MLPKPVWREHRFIEEEFADATALIVVQQLSEENGGWPWFDLNSTSTPGESSLVALTPRREFLDPTFPPASSGTSEVKRETYSVVCECWMEADGGIKRLGRLREQRVDIEDEFSLPSRPSFIRNIGEAFHAA